jgi:hypothetical protein
VSGGPETEPVPEPRTAAPRPRSVEAVVRAVRASLRATHAAESALLFATGWLCARGALLSAPAADRAAVGAAFVELLCGALCAATWWLEHRVELGSTARELDRRLGHRGALATAFELEQSRMGELSSMEELVRLRVLERLRTRQAVRAVFPSLLLPLGAPAVAALGLVLLTDAHRAALPAPADPVALAAGLARALALGTLEPETAGLEGAGEDGGLSREQLERLGEVLRAPSALPRTIEEWTRAPEAVRERLAELDRRITDLAREVAPGSELRARLEEARTWLDALRTSSAASPGGPSGTELAGGSGTGGATKPPANGTISGSKAPTDVPPTPRTIDPALPSTGAAGAAQLGLQAGNAWPSEYDDVIERWIELSRAAQAGGR